jgi:hypothetical protein
MTGDGFAEAHGLTRTADQATESTETIDLGNGITGQRHEDGRVLVTWKNNKGKEGGYWLNAREAAEAGYLASRR